MYIGYGRVSGRDQNPNLQIDALTKAGCEKLFIEKVSAVKKNRPELGKAMEQLRPGDFLVIWKLSRLARSLQDLVELVRKLREMQVGLIVINMNLNTETALGRLFLNICGSFDEFDRENIIENTMAGLEAARARGRVGGRRAGLSKKAQVTAAAAETLYRERKLSVTQIMEQLGIKSKETFYKYLRLRGVQIGNHE